MSLVGPPTWGELEEKPSWSWATVTQVSPLRVAFAGVELAGIAPENLEGDLKVGDRVFCQMQPSPHSSAKQVIILGHSQPVQPLPLPVSWTTSGASNQITATAWADVPNTGTASLVVPAGRSMLVDVTYYGWFGTTPTTRDLRVMAAWSKAGGGGGSAYSEFGWQGVLYQASDDVYASRSITLPVVLSEGTWTFRLQAYTVGAQGTGPLIAYSGGVVKPIRWV